MKFLCAICLLTTALVSGDEVTDTRTADLGSLLFHNSGGGFPVNALPGQGFPGQGFPGQGFPGQGFPGQGFPGQGFPGQGFPGQGFPGQGLPGQGFPGQGYPGASGTCKYWCRTPEGQAYCCDQGNNGGNFPIVRRGYCPPVRPLCPPTRFGGPPINCAHDNDCGNNSDKCCFDRCLEQHVCKPAQGIGFGKR
ncbi:RNA-binding protein 12-like [Palaemon carinicauda]|uniref:RNA-binding protein 12-like n=1 Tax=Palaemon carinicauda TaxID=392227 RepID=UPI0035B58B44